MRTQINISLEDKVLNNIKHSARKASFKEEKDYTYLDLIRDTLTKSFSVKGSD